MISCIYLLSFAILVTNIVKSIKKDKYLSISNVFLFTLSFLYLLVPGLMFLTGTANSTISNVIVSSTIDDRVTAYLYIMTMVICVIVAKNSLFEKKQQNYQLDNLYLDINQAACEKSIIYSVCIKWFCALFVIGILGFLMMVSQIGFWGFITYSGASRGEGAELSGSMIGYGKFLAKFMIASLSPGMMVYETTKRRFFKYILIGIFVLSFMLEIFIAGKSNFILFLLPFFMRFMGRKNKGIDINKIVVLGVVMLSLVFLLDNWFYSLEMGESVSQYRKDWTFDRYFMRYLHEYLYPYSNVLLSKKMNIEFGYRLFIDYLAVFINFIPATFLNGFQIKLLYPEVTKTYEMISGSKSAGVPADYLTFCIRQLGIIGVISISIICSKLLQFVDAHLARVKKHCELLHINAYHMLTCCSAFGFIIVLIEPYSAISTQPILFTSVLIIIQLSNKFRIEEKGK